MIATTKFESIQTPFHIRFSNHRKDIKNLLPIEACKHFNNRNHVFHKHGKLTLIEQLNSIKNTSTEVLKQKLKDRENYWIKRLKTLTPFGLNQELNYVHEMQYFFRLNNIKNTSREVLKQRLKVRENYWIKRLKTLTPFGLNQELN